MDLSEFDGYLIHEGKNLLKMEKERRGIDENQLLFIGMANTAEYYWCAMKSLLANKDMEIAYFGSYLEDRIKYSLELGYIDKIPNDMEKLLDVGEDITWDDIEKLLKERGEDNRSAVADIVAETTHDRDGNKVLVINPFADEYNKEMAIIDAKMKGIKVITDLQEAPPTTRGEFLHRIFEERYQTIRWNFPWKEYVVVGVPDGITDKFVYEFKTTRNNFLKRFAKPVAFAQANLYGYFFRRPQRRIQMYVVEDKFLNTWQEKTKPEDAISLLTQFRKADYAGDIIPPKSWKCKSCMFRNICPIARK